MKRFLGAVLIVMTGGWISAEFSRETVAATAPGMLRVKKGDLIALVGDSITEQKMYSRFMEDYLTACVPQLDLRVIQLGWGGETAPQFLARMDTDLLPLQANVVTFCYGMNDGQYRAYEDSIGTSYREALSKIISGVRAQGALVVVGSPGIVDHFNGAVSSEVYNENLGHLRDIAREVALGSNSVFTDIHSRMDLANRKAKTLYGEKYPITYDGVHPRLNGHLVMAYTFLKSMGFNGEIGRITLDLKAKTGDASEGHRILSLQGSNLEIESTRYPFCFSGDPESPDSPRSILPFLPFNDDLNRFVLVVKNLHSDKAKVHWGDFSKEFTSNELVRGVNLAAEFQENPFSAPFTRLDGRVLRKQMFETLMIKETPGNLRNLQNELGRNETLENYSSFIRSELLKKYKSLEAEIKAIIQPVHYTIRVEEIADTK